MGNSLQDQLLKAGLVDSQKAKQSRSEKRKQRRQEQHHKTETEDQAKLAVRKALADKAERDRRLNQQRAENAQQRATAAQVRQLIETNRQAKGDPEVAYNFADGGTVKSVRVARRTREQIAKGQLAIVKLGNQYELVPLETAGRLNVLDAQCVLVHNEPKPPRREEDDPYAGYEVPDDLIW